MKPDNVHIHGTRNVAEWLQPFGDQIISRWFMRSSSSMPGVPLQNLRDNIRRLEEKCSPGNVGFFDASSLMYTLVACRELLH